ncbi:MAG: enoyl-ACP reductase FabI [Alphaproteobacteria bacterium]|nr:enoyl-ACP reductase FabI [Alphaproteobacteria bacterium]
MFSLNGKRGIILGIANEHSIAAGCAAALKNAGAELLITYLNDKAKPYVAAVAGTLDTDFLLPCDVRVPGSLESVFAAAKARWGGIDFVLHSIAYAPKEDLLGRVTDCSEAGFLEAMAISCHSFIRCARLSEPLMAKGGTLLTVTFYGSERVVPRYNLMGPVKAALESSMRVLACELGEQGVRVHALSPGPIKTRAASGLDRFDALLEETKARTPSHKLVEIEDVGALAAFLCSDKARALTGAVHYVDYGLNVLA